MTRYNILFVSITFRGKKITNRKISFASLRRWNNHDIKELEATCTNVTNEALAVYWYNAAVKFADAFKRCERHLCCRTASALCWLTWYSLTICGWWSSFIICISRCTFLRFVSSNWVLSMILMATWANGEKGKRFQWNLRLPSAPCPAFARTQHQTSTSDIVWSISFTVHKTASMRSPGFLWRGVLPASPPRSYLCQWSSRCRRIQL